MKKLLLALWLSALSWPAFAGVSCTLPFNLQNGTLADATQVMANYNALVTCLGNAAAAGINTDITALNGLTTPLVPASGGSSVFLGGTSTGPANAYVVSGTTPTNFALNSEYTVIFIANVTNTGGSTLAVGSTPATNIYKQTSSGPVALTGGEIVAGQIVVVWFDGTQYEMQAQLSASSSASLGQPINMSLSASASSDQLTISVLGANGALPSTANPVLASFNSAGSNIFATITAATTFTMSSTSSMGCTTAVVCRLWIELICQTISGTTCTSPLVGASVQSTPSDPVTSVASCKPLMENNLQSTGSGTGGGTAYNTIQTSVSSVSNAPIRIIGFVEAVWVSGVGWSTPPSKLVLFSPGTKKPCDLVQQAFANGSSLSMTPSSAINLVKLSSSTTGQGTTSGLVQMSLVRGATTLLTQSFQVSGTVTVDNIPFAIDWLDAPKTASATTYSISGNGLTPTNSSLEADEIMG